MVLYIHSPIRLHVMVWYLVQHRDNSSYISIMGATAARSL